MAEDIILKAGQMRWMAVSSSHRVTAWGMRTPWHAGSQGVCTRKMSELAGAVGGTLEP